MDDIAPGLLDTLQKAFADNLATDKRGQELLKIIAKGGNYETAGEYAETVGTALAKAFKDNLTADILPDGKMYRNIAERAVSPLLRNDYDIVSKVAVQAQDAINKAAGIGLKAQTAPLNEDRINGILTRLSNADNYNDISWILDSPVVNFTMAVVDDTIKRNAEFQSKTGLTPKINRKVRGKCCEWCTNLAGTYEYPDDVPQDVYKRHDNCRCVVEFLPAKKHAKAEIIHSGKEGKRTYEKSKSGKSYHKINSEENGKARAKKTTKVKQKYTEKNSEALAKRKAEMQKRFDMLTKKPVTSPETIEARKTIGLLDKKTPPDR